MVNNRRRGFRQTRLRSTSESKTSACKKKKTCIVIRINVAASVHNIIIIMNDRFRQKVPGDCFGVDFIFFRRDEKNEQTGTSNLSLHRRLTLKLGTHKGSTAMF